jgi:hypothetical protein
MVIHVRYPKETLLHLPSLVPLAEDSDARSAYWLTSASLSKSGLSGGSPEKKQKQWRERNPDYFIARRMLDRGKAIVGLNRYAYRHH